MTNMISPGWDVLGASTTFGTGVLVGVGVVPGIGVAVGEGVGVGVAGDTGEIDTKTRSWDRPMRMARREGTDSNAAKP